MMPGEIRLTLFCWPVDGLRLSVGLPLLQFQRQQLGLREWTVDLRGVRLDHEGLWLDWTGGGMRYEAGNDDIDAWTQFWQFIDKNRSFESLEAFVVLDLFRHLNMLAAVRKGRIHFSDIRRDNPDLLTRGNFKDALAQAFLTDAPLSPEPVTSRAPALTAGQIELYGWACWCLATGVESSFDSACDHACTDHPHLVPPSWGDDPGGNLKRLAYRRLDKSAFSQATLRI